jgi:hypothetical protein
VKKNKKTVISKLLSWSEKSTIYLMTAGTLLGLVNAAEQLNSKIIVPSTVTFSMEVNNSQINNPIRREREEAGPHYTSYSESQRTPGRSRKID